MENFSVEKHDKIIDELRKNGAVWNCTCCKNNNFIVFDVFFDNVINSTITAGSEKKSTVIVCNRCGYIRQYSPAVSDAI